MIGSFASGTTTALKINLLTLQLSIVIFCYLEAEIGYRPFLLFYSFASKDSAQYISSQTKQDIYIFFCNFCSSCNLSQKLIKIICFSSLTEGGRHPAGTEEP